MIWLWVEIILVVLLTWLIISISVSLILGPMLARRSNRYRDAVPKISENQKISEQRKR